ncbi:hypothetical protein [Flavobacterium silvaticum]|uniref:Uncharacterized protein n=1 Tax=Flavobacterium silvaticum TaxID=1852020 RepID=A0A972FVK6_9FLAO|nr:hypothetical protein [Flavobacterium silvaticum]NMH28415.1 hypothetical protein [Flavobacterium silvaticum]
MKLVVQIFVLFFGFQMVAQPVLYQKGGKKLTVKYVISDPKKTFVKVESDGKISKINNSEIDSIRMENQLMKPILDGKKPKLFFIISKKGNRELAVNKSEIIKNRGGFESVQTFYNLVVSEDGKISKTLTFSNSETEKEVSNRNQIFSFITDNFADCPKVTSHFQLFKNDTDKLNLTILNYLDKPDTVKCK